MTQNGLNWGLTDGRERRGDPPPRYKPPGRRQRVAKGTRLRRGYSGRAAAETAGKAREADWIGTADAGGREIPWERFSEAREGGEVIDGGARRGEGLSAHGQPKNVRCLRSTDYGNVFPINSQTTLRIGGHPTCQRKKKARKRKKAGKKKRVLKKSRSRIWKRAQSWIDREVTREAATIGHAPRKAEEDDEPESGNYAGPREI
jgi:hypothetical protein